MIKTYVYDGKKKSVDLWGDDLSGWTVYGGDEMTNDESYYRLIPTLHRAVELRAGAVATMPFQITKGKTVYDSSRDWQNKVGFMPNPNSLLQLIESALIMAGRCYLFRERSAVTTKLLRYHLPFSVTPEINRSSGKIEYFIRPVNGVQKKFRPEDYVYFWPPDPYVEIGPSENYPAKAAANACGVLLNFDIFASNFFERGAIKITLLTVKGMPGEAEVKKLEAWWQKIVGGVKNAFGSKVMNADAVTPVVIGEGMKELENATIGEDKREDIAVAVGIPMSILFANAANYATSQQDDLNFLTKTIVPECEFIASVLNEQIFEPLGLHWEFLPETLDAMQEDEASRAAALLQLTNAGIPLLMAMDLLGYELTDEQRAELEQAAQEKEERAEAMVERLQSTPESEDEPEEESQEPEREEMQPEYKADLERWCRKAIHAVKRGEPANVTYTTLYIPEDVCQTITSSLEHVTTEAGVVQVFKEAMTPAPKFESGIMALATQLKRANDLLERTHE